jgi:hypothetical protein
MYIMTLFPAVLVLYHEYFEEKRGCDKCIKEESHSHCATCLAERCCSCSCAKLAVTSTDKANTTTDAPPRPAIEVFFETSFSSFVLSTKGRVIIFVVAVAWFIPAMIHAAQLQPTDKTGNEVWFSDGYWYVVLLSFWVAVCCQ